MANLTLAEMHALADDIAVGDIIESAMTLVALDVLDETEDIPEYDRRHRLAEEVINSGPNLNQGRRMTIVSYFPKSLNTPAKVLADEGKVVTAVREAWTKTAGGRSNAQASVKVSASLDPIFQEKLVPVLLKIAAELIDAEDGTEESYAIGKRINAEPILNGIRMAGVIVTAKDPALTADSLSEDIEEYARIAIRREIRAETKVKSVTIQSVSPASLAEANTDEPVDPKLAELGRQLAQQMTGR